jgi:hypothetical protein
MKLSLSNLPSSDVRRTLFSIFVATPIFFEFLKATIQPFPSTTYIGFSIITLDPDNMMNPWLDRFNGSGCLLASLAA